jgi:hypothetical protein
MTGSYERRFNPTGGNRPTPVSDDDEMLAPKRPLAGSGRLIEWRSETKL